MTILDAPDNISVIPSRGHDRRTFLYAIAKMFERASYYGLRSIIVLFLIDGFFEMGESEALKIYGVYTLVFLVMEVLGAIFGDLIFGNRKSILLGSILQTLGALFMCIPEMFSFYIGAILVATGSGMFTSNILANFGKSYLHKIHLVDAGFSIFYFAINIGILLGILSIGYIGESYGWSFGFALAAFFSLLSFLSILSLKNEPLSLSETYSLPSNKIITRLILAVLLTALFWGVYSIIGWPISRLELNLTEVLTQENIWFNQWLPYTASFVLLIAPIFAIIWTYIYSSRSFKLMMSFFLMALSTGILFFVSGEIQIEYVPFFLLATFILATAEMYVFPVVLSMVTQYANPRYFSIVFALTGLPLKLIGRIITSLAILNLYEIPTRNLSIGFVIALICGIGVAIFIISNKLAFNKKS